MQVIIDTNNLSDLDLAMLGFLAERGAEGEGGEEIEAPATEEPAAAKPAKAKATKAEPEEDLVGGPTLSDAVAAATQLVSKGEAAKVKEALAKVDAKRVSEIDPAKVADFLAALEA